MQDLKDERGVVLFALYSDLRRFMVLCDDKQTSQQELTMLAKQIYKDFILPGSDFQIEDNLIIKEIRAGFNIKTDTIILPIDESLF